ncbi:sulfotransferase [Alteromonadaceae bacterium BrNp21-10]|nr:sulfotransferase [Alteromonadaceae bacterium BrNp21-10]
MQNLQQLHQQAIELINRQQFQQAHPLLVSVVRRQPEHADSWFLLGIINFELGQVRKSISLIEKAIGIKAMPEYLAHLAKSYALMGDLNRAKALAIQAPASDIDQPLTLDTLGVALSRVGLHHEALNYFTKAISLVSSNPQFFYNYAVACKFIGDFDKARDAFEAAIQLQPDYHQAHFALADLGDTTVEKNHIPRLQQVLTRCVHPDATLHIYHALAKEHESIKAYAKAFEYLQQGKQNKLATLNYQIADDLKLFAISLQQLSLSQVDATGHPSNEPIFVLGMPRSGTTLVERIISNHSDVTSAGELQDFGMAVKELTKTPSQKVLDIDTLEQAEILNFNTLGQTYLDRTRALTGNTPRFIDKLPFNFFYLGLIKQALPNAKIICLLRNPMDTCIGNFRQLFSINSPYYYYAYDLETISQFYRQFHQLAHATAQLGWDNFKLVNYEQLVSDPEQQVRELIDFCDLDWQQQCLHVEKNTAPVSTASKVQVREPINTQSIGRWQHYSDNTQSIQQQLADLMPQ